MVQDHAKPSGPDLARGISLAELADGGKLVGHVSGEQVLLVRRGTEVFAVGARCTHYGGPLIDGLVVDDTVRCPWHHACFDLRTGEALRAPALSPIACWSVEQRDGKIFVQGKPTRLEPKQRGEASGKASKFGTKHPAANPPRLAARTTTQTSSEYRGIPLSNGRPHEERH
jgi:nitrite reductase/ring-hydroxylating ferredoxin subunit